MKRGTARLGSEPSLEACQAGSSSAKASGERRPSGTRPLGQASPEAAVESKASRQVTAKLVPAPPDTPASGIPAFDELDAAAQDPDRPPDRAAAYVPPTEIVQPTDHRTIDLKRVRVDKAVEPWRSAPTVKNLPRPQPSSVAPELDGGRRTHKQAWLLLFLGFAALLGALVVWLWVRGLGPSEDAGVGKQAPAAEPADKRQLEEAPQETPRQVAGKGEAEADSIAESRGREAPAAQPSSTLKPAGEMTPKIPTPAPPKVKRRQPASSKTPPLAKPIHE